MLPEIYDFAVDHDNTIYAQSQTACDISTAYSSEPFLSLLTSPDYTPAMPPNMGFFFDSTEFESYGSSFYTPYMTELQARIAAEDLASDLPTPLVALLGDVTEDVPDENAETRDDHPVQCPSRPPTPMAAQPRSLVDTAPSPSPTPSLSYSAQSTHSSPSPASVIDDDVHALEEDTEDCSPMPSSPARPLKRGASALSAPPAKKRNVSMTPVSLPSARAARYPCTVPGCKQVCKTLGDLKRHESILAHKPPSWECPRCHYHFTREDALKRHIKNVSNCANAKARVREKVVSIEPQHLSVDTEIEAV
jgi:Zinc finger, C2H2 type